MAACSFRGRRPIPRKEEGESCDGVCDAGVTAQLGAVSGKVATKLDVSLVMVNPTGGGRGDRQLSQDGWPTSCLVREVPFLPGSSPALTFWATTSGT